MRSGFLLIVRLSQDCFASGDRFSMPGATDGWDRILQISCIVFMHLNKFTLFRRHTR